MPLFIPDESIKWSETDEKLNITVPLPKPSHKNLTILSASSYIKVSFPPHFWECFLYGTIDAERSIARTDNSSVAFELLKSENGLWGNLKHVKSSDGEFCRQQREYAIKEIQERTAAITKQKCTERHENQRASVRKQMELDDQERKRIEKLKETECRLVTAEVEELEKSSVMKVHKTSRKDTVVAYSPTKPSKLVEVTNEPHAIRKFGNITVNFTPRVFPTAARESQDFDETKWLEKQAEARKSFDFDTKDLSQKERNPVWLKEKGDTFYARGDFHSAVNAYNLAIRICPTMYSLFSNRAACHLKLHNLHKAIEDSSKALELMGPPTDSNSASCCKCHARRAAAFCQLEFYVEGLMDFEAALKIEPHNEELKADAEKIRTLIQSQ